MGNLPVTNRPKGVPNFPHLVIWGALPDNLFSYFILFCPHTFHSGCSLSSIWVALLIMLPYTQTPKCHLILVFTFKIVSLIWVFHSRPPNRKPILDVNIWSFVQGTENVPTIWTVYRVWTISHLGVLQESGARTLLGVLLVQTGGSPEQQSVAICTLPEPNTAAMVAAAFPPKLHLMS